MCWLLITLALSSAPIFRSAPVELHPYYLWWTGYYDRLTNSQENTALIPHPSGEGGSVASGSTNRKESMALIPPGRLPVPDEGHLGLGPKIPFPPTGPSNHSNEPVRVWVCLPGYDSQLPWPQNQGFRVPGVSGCRNGRRKSRYDSKGGPPLWSAGPCLLGVPRRLQISSPSCHRPLEFQPFHSS